MYSNNALIFGGGRWSRVIATVLDKLLMEDAKIQMYSPHNADYLLAWVKQFNLDQRIDVFDEYPKVETIKKTSLAIVANAAEDHFSTAVFCLYHSIPTLIEKPFAMTVADIDFIANFSKKTKTPVYSGHVFLFAKYIESFSEEVNKLGLIKEINIDWLDSIAENRYGEQKQYDHKVTVLHDVFPHIASILRFFSNAKINYEGIEIDRGGALVKLRLNIDNIKSTIVMARNESKRQRLIEIKTDGGNAVLDFSSEPGEITINGEINNAFPNWEASNKPLHLMLKSFFDTNADIKKSDDRFSPSIAKEACEIVELAYRDYRNIIVDFLSSEKNKINDNDVKYALSELTRIKK